MPELLLDPGPAGRDAGRPAAARANPTPGARARRHEDATDRSRSGCDRAVMQFAPAVDPRLARAITRMVDIDCSAVVLRALRPRARRLGVPRPCYETVRKLVHLERERRARVAAAIMTALEIARRRVPVLPEHVPRIYRRHLERARRRFRCRAAPP